MRPVSTSVLSGGRTVLEHGLVPYRFSTSSISPPQRADEWRAVSSAQFVPLDPMPIGEPQRFGARLVADHFADCGWALISTTKHTVNRTESTIAQSSPGIVFVNLQLQGNGTLTQSGATKNIAQGDVAVIDTEAPFTLSYPDDMKMACFSIPKDSYNVDPTARVVAGATRYGSVLATYLRGLALGGVQATEHPRALADQLASLLGKCTSNGLASQSARTIAELRDVIEIHLANPRLSTSDLASLMYLSRSRLYEVLAAEHLTVRGMLNEARLDRAEKYLRDREHSHHSVMRIAEQVGFADAGTFARAFKRRHGTTPGAWRNHLDSARIQT